MTSKASPAANGSTAQGHATDDVHAASLPVTLYERPVWFPQTVAADYGAAASKFGGICLVSAEYPTPECPSCGQPMPLFLQLNPADLPAEMAAKLHGKVLQLFYCTGEISEEPPHNEYDCENFKPYRRGVVVRLIQFAEPIAGELPVHSFAAQTIVGWTATEEAPHVADWEKTGFPAGVSEPAAVGKAPLMECSGHDKLGGWPYWSLVPGWPSCAECKERMEPLFQLVSKDHIPYMIGNGARGFIWQCPNHPDVLFFYWDEWSLVA